MRIALASDHAGFEQKQMMFEYLTESGYEVVDLGPADDSRVDYPDFGEKVARCVSENHADRGVLICGTGIGMALAADKIRGVRAACIQTPQFAQLFREHNDGNVICLSGRFVEPKTNCEVVDAFLNTEFAGGRHQGRVEKIMALDDAE